MFTTYLKLAWRNLWKSKVLTGVNLLGMTVAFAAALLLVMTIYFEMSYDRFHKNGDAIFQVYRSENTKDKTNDQSTVPLPLQAAIVNEVPNIQAASRFMTTGGIVRYGNKTMPGSMGLVDEDFFRMFSFPVLSGETQRPLRELNDVALTQKVATALFGATSPVGKAVEIDMGSGFEGYVVSAVVADAPLNSSINNGMYLRLEKFADYAVVKDLWGASCTSQFVQLKDPAQTAAFMAGTQNILHRYQQNFLDRDKKDGIKADAEGHTRRYPLIPLREVHFNTFTRVGTGVQHRYVYLLMLIAGFVLFIATTNFVNITLARAFARGREIGIRKVMGAVRRQLLVQLWGEAFILCAVAMLTGLLLAGLLLPGFNSLFRTDIRFGLLLQPALLVGVVAGFIMITVLAGGYPAWRLARLNTVKVLKGQVSAGKGQGLRNTLIVAQFVIAAALICCTLVAWQQVQFLRNQPLGFNKTQVISIPLETGQDPAKLLQLLRDKLGNPNISGSDINLGTGLDGGNNFSTMGFDYKDHTVSTRWINVAYDYVATLELQLVAGRDFSRKFPSDVEEGLLINQAMARQLGGEQAAIGAALPLGHDGHPMKVIGVVKDFNFESLRTGIDPLTMTIRAPSYMNYIFVKVPAGNLPASMERVRRAWAELAPGKDFRASFLDENTDRQYRQEGRLTAIFIGSAVLAIVIACMGLFAVAVMAMTLRTREVGIRKVLGASVQNIVALLSGDFLKLVLLAMLIALPLSWWGMQQWLADYAYRVQVQAWVLAAGGSIAIGIALLTISFNALRRALDNPVKSLRNE